MKKFIALTLAAIIGVSSGVAIGFMFQMENISDSTMLPSYEEGQSVLINRMSYKTAIPNRGDVVAFHNWVYADTGEDSTMIKRVVGVSGDIVEIKSGQVYVNDRKLSEKYVFASGTSGEMNATVIKDNHVFVMGDNRAASTDSRDVVVGQVKVSDLMGKVIFKW